MLQSAYSVCVTNTTVYKYLQKISMQVIVEPKQVFEPYYVIVSNLSLVCTQFLSTLSYLLFLR